MISLSDCFVEIAFYRAYITISKISIVSKIYLIQKGTSKQTAVTKMKESTYGQGLSLWSSMMQSNDVSLVLLGTLVVAVIKLFCTYAKLIKGKKLPCPGMTDQSLIPASCVIIDSRRPPNRAHEVKNSKS